MKKQDTMEVMKVCLSTSSVKWREILQCVGLFLRCDIMGASCVQVFCYCRDLHLSMYFSGSVPRTLSCTFL